jgi:phosphoribosylanthranilate isomerase
MQSLFPTRPPWGFASLPDLGSYEFHTAVSDLAAKPFFQTAADRVRVKICGITNERDAVAAIEAGADALGLNLCSVSKRFLNLERESDWIRRLPDKIARVAIVADPPINQAIDWSKSGLFDCLQLHGHESLAFCESVRDIPLVKAVRLKSLDALRRVHNYPVFGFLLDSHRTGSLGGTGTTFDWNLLRNVILNKPMLVAGGLTPENVVELLRIVKPHAVDVASGVESTPGRKDPSKMRDFVAAVKRASSS